MKILKYLINTIRDLLYMRATEYTEMELEEMEHVFALIVLGFLVGYPIVPPSLSLKLLPHMKEEVLLMFERARNLDDQWSLVGMDIE